MDFSRLVLAVALSLVLTCAVTAPNPAEAQKIEQLIASVEGLREAKFIRNGTAYDANKAAEHLRLKLREAGSRVANAEDFIRLCAARSSVSGRPYEIAFDDGRRVTSEAFLRGRLKELEARATGR